MIRLFSFAVALLFTVELAVNTSTAQAEESFDVARFERTMVAGGLIQPMEFDIATDGTVFLIELAGKLKTVDPRTGQQQVVGELSVTTAQENGLIGLALAPDFATSHWIYLQYSPPDFSGQRVSRFKFLNGKLLLESEQRLLEYEEQRRECCHHAGCLEFGPDGCLFISTGDNTNPFEFSEGFAPIDERSGREPWDAQRTSANSRNFNGKVLRIRPEADGSYSIPDGNLFPKDGSLGLPEIYVMGCRNPWRISVDQHSGFLYWGDVGPDAGVNGPRGPRGYDEINQARHAGFFGWPYFIGDNFAYYDYDFETKIIGEPFDVAKPINDSRNNTGARELPPAQAAMIFYPGVAFDKFPEVGLGGRTACAGPVYYEGDYASSPLRLPSHFDRTLFAFEWSRNWILAVHLDEEFHVKKLEPFLPDEKFTRPIQLKFDAGGSLYALLYGETWGVNPDAQLVRIDYVRGNRTPKAELSIDRTAGREPLTVQLSGEASTDRDGDDLNFHWSYVAAQATADSPPGTEIPFSNSRSPELTLNTPGVFTVHLDVSDPSGATTRQSTNVIVGNDPPQLRFLKPLEGGFFAPGQILRYELEISDSEDGTSNYSAAGDSTNLKELDPEAFARAFVQAVPVGLDGQPIAEENTSPGLKLIRQSGCLNCHATNRPLVGPAFMEVANKYRDQAGQLEKSIERVQKGSTGIWGKVPMLPHSHRTRDEIQMMVEYVLSLKSVDDISMVQGLNNELNIPADAVAIRLDATYTDSGDRALPAVTGKATLRLLSRKIQAEQAADYRGTQPLGSGNAEGGKFMGAVNHDGFLKFSRIPMADVGGIRVSVASAGAGGKIEFRLGSVSGPAIASIPVLVNGKWEDFYQQESAVERFQGVADLFAVFINETNRGGLMNIDWIEFLPEK